jgi:hypothetical protein
MSFLKRISVIKQAMKKDKITMEYTWDINSVNDSVTNVSVGIKELNNSIYNRLTALLALVLKGTNKKITDFRDGLNKHKSFKVQIDGEATSEVTFVAYINLKSVLQEANHDNDAVITGFLQQNDIKIVGKPYVGPKLESG